MADLANDLSPDGLYHLATAQEWASYELGSQISPASLTAEGFVHCSWGRQVAGTVRRHFAGVDGILALRLEPAALGDVALVEEDTTGSGQRFPHAYGPIPRLAVIDVTVLS
jgi:uncharacterized protein (DUF952 family)